MYFGNDLDVKADDNFQAPHWGSPVSLSQSIQTLDHCYCEEK